MRYNGYYLSMPTTYIDYVAGSNQRTGVVHSAYLFLDNGLIKRQSKESKNTVMPFEKADFENGYSGEYATEGDTLYVVFDRGKQWELRTTYKISNDRITSIESNSAGGVGQVYEFREW